MNSKKQLPEQKNIGDRATPSFKQSCVMWGKIGLLSFGGPTAQIALMHKLIVSEQRWLSEDQFLNALSFCMLLPGPEAMQLATYTGWRIHGVAGGLIAGLLFVLPGAVIMLTLGIVYVNFGTIGFIGAAFLGLKAAIVVIVLQALLRLAKKTLKSATLWVIAAISFASIFFFALPFPLIIALAAIYGFFKIMNHQKKIIAPTLPKSRDIFKITLICAGLWWAPIISIDLIANASLMAEIGYFFSKLAIVSFGGAYAVLAYMVQDVIGQFGWLTPAEMMDGLGLAETTPGPLILVTEFVGFLAAFKTAGLLHGVFGAIVALWATFAPCFLWIFAGGPYIDWLTNQPRLQGALSGIMAVVVGVIANLFLWFGINLFFNETMTIDIEIASFLMPDFTSLDMRVSAIAILCGWLAIWRRIGLFWLLGIAASGGVLVKIIATG